MHIRFALEKDYDEILPLMQEIHALHVKHRPDIYLDTLDCYPRSFFLKQVESNSLLVADIEGKAVGIIAFFEKKQNSPVHVPRKILYIDIVGVKEEFRGKGIGRTLFNEVRKYATDNGFDSIELDVNSWNTDALSLYENIGFSEDWKRMSLSLNQ